MNSLSILIYAAEVIGRLGPLFGGGIFICLAVALFAFLASLPNDPNKELAPRPLRHSKKAFFLALVFGFLALITPSARTIYMIAASEVGEQVVNTPEAREVLEAVRGRIMEELKGGGDE